MMGGVRVRTRACDEGAMPYQHTDTSFPLLCWHLDGDGRRMRRRVSAYVWSE
jgi:hypothetical protein